MRKSLSAWLFVSLCSTTFGVTCKDSVTYSCLKEKTPGTTVRCLEYFTEPTEAKPCGNKAIFLDGRCPNADIVGSCEAEFAGREVTMHFYSAQYSADDAVNACKSFHGALCTF